jgi:hypothetical protein
MDARFLKRIKLAPGPSLTLRRPRLPGSAGPKIAPLSMAPRGGARGLGLSDLPRRYCAGLDAAGGPLLQGAAPPVAPGVWLAFVQNKIQYRRELGEPSNSPVSIH